MAFTPGFFQAGFVVDDLDASMEAWVAEGVGPFYAVRNPGATNVMHRGKPIDLQFTAAFAQSGGIQIELLCQQNEGPSYYRDVFGPGQGGFHHMNRFTDDFDAEIARYTARGIEVAGQGLSGDMRFAYVDTRKQIGMMTEIIEDRPFIHELFKLIADSAVNWDGSHPFREVEFTMAEGATAPTIGWRPRD